MFVVVASASGWSYVVFVVLVSLPVCSIFSWLRAACAFSAACSAGWRSHIRPLPFGRYGRAEPYTTGAAFRCFLTTFAGSSAFSRERVGGRKRARSFARPTDVLRFLPLRARIECVPALLWPTSTDVRILAQRYTSLLPICPIILPRCICAE